MSCTYIQDRGIHGPIFQKSRIAVGVAMWKPRGVVHPNVLDFHYGFNWFWSCGSAITAVFIVLYLNGQFKIFISFRNVASQGNVSSIWVNSKYIVVTWNPKWDVHALQLWQ